MAKSTVTPIGCWPPLLRDELAAAYAGEKTVEQFIRRVGTVWPKPFIDVGSGKGRYRAWRRMDIDQIISPQSAGGDPEAL